MLPFFVKATAEKTIPIVPIITGNFQNGLAEQNQRIQNWVQADLFKADIGIKLFHHGCRWPAGTVLLA